MVCNKFNYSPSPLRALNNGWTFPHDKLEQFCCLFDLKSIMKKENCITKMHKSITGLILTSKRFVFQSNWVTETNFKNSDENSFDENSQVREAIVDLLTNYLNEIYCFIADTFIEVVKRHEPLKKIFFRGNQSPFMNKELRKVIYTKC